jgi:hypothetical protein
MCWASAILPSQLARLGWLQLAFTRPEVDLVPPHFWLAFSDLARIAPAFPFSTFEELNRQWKSDS